ncbi:alpha/beta hydrolase [Verrucomicrobiales bacterium]|nr:alpha/beta hydrolase [Verrucomicrobiales bacterium]MDB4467714.1 alpha/beta hydrolase [Verrucomicrobiales bacterium]MDF1789492.1 alpha/beta fold hydrolase [Verrucomicrobiales bacterium]
MKYGHALNTLILIQGRNGRKESLLRVAEQFTAIGFRCLIPDLPAHGESPIAHVAHGASSMEKALPSKMITNARQTLGWPSADAPIGLWGMSMGGAMATAAAAAT